MDKGLIVCAFTAGMVATVNPCGFAMLPAYISYYLATGEGNPSPTGALPRLLRPLLVDGTLTAGFLALFAVAGTLISLGARALVSAMPWIGLLIGVGLVLLGGWLLLGRHVALPGLPHTLLPQLIEKILLVVVGSTFTRRGIGAGLAQFLAYGLGMGAVLMALTLSLALLEGVLVGYLRRPVPYVERASAVLLLGAGAYIVYYWLTVGQLLRSMGRTEPIPYLGSGL